MCIAEQRKATFSTGRTLACVRVSPNLKAFTSGMQFRQRRGLWFFPSPLLRSATVHFRAAGCAGMDGRTDGRTGAGHVLPRLPSSECSQTALRPSLPPSSTGRLSGRQMLGGRGRNFEISHGKMTICLSCHLFRCSREKCIRGAEAIFFYLILMTHNRI